MGQVYIPNQGELEALKAILSKVALQLMLYGNTLTPDNTLSLANLTELTKGVGYGYAQVQLNPVVNEGAAAAGVWNVGLNAAGAAQGVYGLAAAPVTWTMTADDVAAAETVYGLGAYTWILPFTTGLAAGGTTALLGATVTGGTSTATGIITGVTVESGSWGAGAAGYFNIMTKTGAFQTGEALKIGATQIATSATGVVNAGDAWQKLIYVDNFITGTPIASVGQQITVVPTLTLVSQ